LEGGPINIHNLEVPQLQAIVSRYPWFSYAREVLLYNLVKVEPQCLESNYKESLIYFPRRDSVLLECRRLVAMAASEPAGQIVGVAELLDVDGTVVEDMEESFEIDFEQIQKEAESFTCQEDSTDDLIVESHTDATALEVEQPVEQFAPRVVVVGGDYFSKEDFAQLDESEKVADIRFGAPADDVCRELSGGSDEFEVDFDSMDFVTETLAAIYADQGYYDKAIEVYAKLILLYPEKSTYFATLVNEIKSKN